MVDRGPARAWRYSLFMIGQAWHDYLVSVGRPLPQIWVRYTYTNLHSTLQESGSAGERPGKLHPGCPQMRQERLRVLAQFRTHGLSTGRTLFGMLVRRDYTVLDALYFEEVAHDYDQSR